MYPPTSSSQPQKTSGLAQSGLTRYGSAPSSLLASAVDSVICAEREFGSSPPHLLSGGGLYFSGESSSITSESTYKVNSSSESFKPLHRSHGLNEIAARIGTSSSSSSSSSSQSPASSSLLRQRSSPAGFLSHLTNAEKNGNGFYVSRGGGGGGGGGGYGTNAGPGVSRLKSQLSFTTQDSLSQISEVNENGIDLMASENGHHSFSTTNFGLDSWDNNTNSIVFSTPSSKRSKNIDADMYGSLNVLETQFSLPQTTLEIAAAEKLFHIPEDSVPCKIRAKRGCATHPRSIAERERRTRISGKLKKLQDLVPNMDKQTSYADMLDLAVQHIKGLQNQVQKLHTDLESCTCGCKKTT